MRVAGSWLLVVVLLMILPAPARSAPTDIPAFTPNVVDPGGVLDAQGRARVEAEIQRIRDTGIWGAVYIVDTLGDESIEALAVRAFETWRLGQAGVDNGLLLVLAMEDRRSRFEVGYGLEGKITDVAALHALDVHLAPRMREGDTAGAIVAAFGYLSRLVAQDPAAVQELAAAGAASSAEASEDWRRGLAAWGAFLVPVWLGVPFYRAWAAMRRRRLLAAHPSLALRGDEAVANADAGREAPKADWKSRVGISLFLSANPGIFVFILAAIEEAVYYGALVIPGLFVALVTWLKSRKYDSPERYARFLDGIAQERAELLRKGHLVQETAGRYRYTPAYHASRRSSSSSSSSSSRSSSSGGGRSGGGGASSRW
jgi:uncharacterized protein